ncbi:MAG: hypothetical protein LKJ90_08255 [Faecalibacterium sp.]|jgi:methyl-accepting chemotaxis protein|nr:hypothetical protein [Faecalibacterium sp.]
MKKFLTLAATLVLTAALVACGGADVSKLKESYNTLANDYNDMISVATENGWDQDADVVSGLNDIADEISTVKPIVEDPGEATQEQIDELTAQCDELIAWVADMKDVVSVPYADVAAEDAGTSTAGELDVTALTESFNTLAEAYNQMVDVATANGWEQDTEVVDGLNNIATEVSTVKDVIADPSAYTQEQLDEMTATCDELTAWVGDMMEVVANSYVDEA